MEPTLVPPGPPRGIRSLSHPLIASSDRGKDLTERRPSVRRNILEDMLNGQDVLLPVWGLVDGLKEWQEA